MKIITSIIGTIIITAIFMAIPILVSVSLCLGWDSFLSFMFIVGTLIEYIIVFNFILDMAIH